MYTFIEFSAFANVRAAYLDDEEFSELQRFLLASPDAGAVVSGSGGVRKLRWARRGMGKRGGLRVIYYVQDEHNRIWLLTLYGKSARENIPTKTLKLMREVADNATII